MASSSNSASALRVRQQQQALDTASTTSTPMPSSPADDLEQPLIGSSITTSTATMSAGQSGASTNGMATTATVSGNAVISFPEIRMLLRQPDYPTFPMSARVRLGMVLIMSAPIFGLWLGFHMFLNLSDETPSWASPGPSPGGPLKFLLFGLGMFVGVTLLAVGHYFGSLASHKWYFTKYGARKYLHRLETFYTFVYGKDSYCVAQILYALAKYYERQPESAGEHEAFEYYSRIANMARRHPRHGLAVRHLARTAHQMSLHLGRHPESLELLQVALQAQKDMGSLCFVLHLQETLHFIGEAREKMGLWDEALEAYQEALERVREKAPESIAAAKSLVMIASAYKSMGDSDQALTKFEDALEILLKNTGDFPRSKHVAELYEQIGDLQVTKGSIPAAVESFQHAIDVYRRLGRPDEDEILSKLLQRALELRTSCGDG